MEGIGCVNRFFIFREYGLKSFMRGFDEIVECPDEIFDDLFRNVCSRNAHHFLVMKLDGLFAVFVFKESSYINYEVHIDIWRFSIYLLWIDRKAATPFECKCQGRFYPTFNYGLNF